jgi:hypothetical protein
MEHRENSLNDINTKNSALSRIAINLHQSFDRKGVIIMLFGLCLQ